MLQAGVPDDIEFLTKPALATGMICRALDAGVPARWVAGDQVYGAGPALRHELELRRVGYVLAIGCDRRVPTAPDSLRADEVTTGLPQRAWQRLSAGAGAKGQRSYDWAWVTLTPPAATSPDDADTQCWWLLVRRHRHTGELAFYRCYSPEPVPLRELVRVAGRRWTVEESFQAGKGLAGLDEHQVRRWTSWQRWTLFAMLVRRRPDPRADHAGGDDRDLVAAIEVFLTTGITNARTEGTNRLIKQVKRAACGFRNRENYRRRVRLHCTRRTRRLSARNPTVPA